MDIQRGQCVQFVFGKIGIIMDFDVLNVGFFRLAKYASDNSDFRIKVGAVLANKRPIVTGFNKIKTHPEFANPEIHEKISIHAEIDCLIKTKFQHINGTDIYVYRESNGVPAMARPCKSCLKELKSRGVRRIYYSIEHEPYWESEDI